MTNKTLAADALVDTLVRQLRLQEARAGRRAVSTCVALPRHAQTAHTLSLLKRTLQSDGSHTLEIEVVDTAGDPRVLTVDFELSTEAR